MHLMQQYIALPQPNPEWSPQHVIRLQVEALQHNDHPILDSGIRTVFSFASPTNRAMTGPIEHFTAMVKNPLYCSMINHHHADYGDVEIDGNQAQGQVILTDVHGKIVIYVFVLSRQSSGVYAGCWMTDGVMCL